MAEKERTMTIDVVLTKATLDLLWLMGDTVKEANAIGDDRFIVSLDSDLVAEVSDLFDEATFEIALQRLVHFKLGHL